MYLATVPMYRGRLNDALRVLEDGIAADRLEQHVGSSAASKHRLTALIHLERGESAAAVEAGRKCMELRAKVRPHYPAYATEFYISVLCLVGNIDEAERLAAPRIAFHADRPEAATMADFTIFGLLEFAKGNVDEALRYMEKSIERGDPYLHLRSIAAEMAIEAGRLGDAVGLLEAALTRYDAVRAITPIWSVKAHYLLGRAYEGSGWTTKAVEQYETFLHIWKDADPGIPALEDARRRLAGLKSNT
jgi:tetratricopeptide (TPR) repeat protein